MGSEYEVSIYLEGKDKNYVYESIWRGDTLIEALAVMQEYRHRTGCLKLEWRPIEEAPYPEDSRG